MHIHVALSHGLSLSIADASPGAGAYATSRLQRGLLLWDGNTQLAEEAVGFGMPVLKQGLRTLFPGGLSFEVQQDGEVCAIHSRFTLNLVERLQRGTDGMVGSRPLYSVKDLLAATIRQVPGSRGILTAVSSRLRSMLGWQTTYVDAGTRIEVAVKYLIAPRTGKILVETDGIPLGSTVTEAVVMHEQGAGFFDRYRDSSGVRLEGGQIGLWDEVRASEAGFESSTHNVAFTLRRPDGVRLFRGRELVDSRLAWAGFGCSFRPDGKPRRQQITISRLR